MSVFDQLMSLAQSYIWLPGLVFFLVVGGVYWLTRPSPELALEPTGETALHKPKLKEQRNAFRRQGNPVEIHIVEGDAKAEPRIGSVLDRSVGGMRIASFQPVDVGTVISIRPIGVSGIVPWVELEIKSCRPSTEMVDQFEIGCQYVKSPPYSIQLLFG